MKKKVIMIDPKVILEGWTEEDKIRYLKSKGYTDKQITELKKVKE
jgi:hypothetical protein